MSQHGFMLPARPSAASVLRGILADIIDGVLILASVAGFVGGIAIVIAWGL